jgi:3-(3-hydroxy-phenyl)propionate hydroxylase
MSDNNWTNACTRTLLGVKLDVAGTGAWSLVCRETRPPLTLGDRLPDYLVHTPAGRQERLHDVCAGRFTALYFSDVRRRPVVPPQQTPALQHFAVSRFDAPHDGGLRDRSLLDPGDVLFKRLGLPAGTLVLVRPDEHIAAIAALDGDPLQAERLYQAITGRPSACSLS